MPRFGVYEIVGADRRRLRRVLVGQVFIHAQMLAMIERGVYDIFTLVQDIVLRCHTTERECEHMPLPRY